MTPRKALGNWLHEKRQERGFRSAASLSRKAQIALNHTAAIERGEACPRWHTAVRIANALGLKPEGRDEFFRLVDAASKPDGVEDATRGVALPHIVLWRHLPYLLYDRLERWSLFTKMVPDVVLFDGVRSIGATLAWVALCAGPLSRGQRKMLLHDYDGLRSEAEAERYADGAAPLAEISRQAIADAVEGLPHLWRHALFRHGRAATRWTKLIDKWDYSPAGVRGRHPLLTVCFRQPVLERRFGFAMVEPDTVCRCHDALVAFRLASELALIDDEEYLANWLYPAWPDLEECARVVAAATPAAYSKELQSVAGERQSSLTIHDAIRKTTFALRLFEVPHLAARVFGSSDPQTAERFRHNLGELQVVFVKWAEA